MEVLLTWLNGLVLRGKMTGLSPLFNGNIDGFRFRFSQQHQSIDLHLRRTWQLNWGPSVHIISQSHTGIDG